MTIVFNVILHFLLAGSMVLFGAVLFQQVKDAPNSYERVRRALALFVGAMIVLGAQASGVSVATFTVNALAGARSASATASVAAAVFPALLGFGLGFYLVRLNKRNENLSHRVICFVGMIALAAFVTVYASVTQAKGVILGVAAIPNLSFTAGVILVIVFGDENAANTGPNWLPSRVGRVLGGRGTTGAKQRAESVVEQIRNSKRDRV